MIADPLQDVSYTFRIKEAKRQLHELGKKIRQQTDIDPAAQVKDHISSQHFYRCFTNEYHQLGKEYQVNK